MGRWSESCRGGKGAPNPPSVLSSLLGSCCVLLALVDRSTAFVASGGAGVASPGVLLGRRGAASSLGSRTAGLAQPAASVAAVGGQQQQRRRRTQQLGMAIDTTNNPITSKVYGRADAKGASKTPDMNEEIAASGVGWFEGVFLVCLIGARRGLHERTAVCACLLCLASVRHQLQLCGPSSLCLSLSPLSHYVLTHPFPAAFVATAQPHEARVYLNTLHVDQ